LQFLQTYPTVLFVGVKYTIEETMQLITTPTKEAQHADACK